MVKGDGSGEHQVSFEDEADVFEVESVVQAIAVVGQGVDVQVFHSGEGNFGDVELSTTGKRLIRKITWFI